MEGLPQGPGRRPTPKSLQEREMSIRKGQKYHFFFRGKKYFGTVDGDADSLYDEVYMLVECKDEHGQPMKKWYIIKKAWLLTGEDVLTMLN